jgi:acylphosphatase
MIARRVYYSGTVQGVGFRYTTRQVAEGFAVAGYVRNLPDGRVELWAEGDAGEVDGFLEAVARRMAEYVEDRRVQDERPTGLRGFLIRH